MKITDLQSIREFNNNLLKALFNERFFALPVLDKKKREHVAVGLRFPDDDLRIAVLALLLTREDAAELGLKVVPEGPVIQLSMFLSDAQRDKFCALVEMSDGYEGPTQ